MIIGIKGIMGIQDGLDWCISSQMEAGQISGCKDESQVGGQEEVSKEQAQGILKFFNTMDWTFDMSPATDLALANATLPGKLAEHIQQAHGVSLRCTI